MAEFWRADLQSRFYAEPSAGREPCASEGRNIENQRAELTHECSRRITRKINDQRELTTAWP